MPEVDNIIPLSTTLNKFFKTWLEFLKPFHNLTEREQDVAAAFLRNRYELSQKISDPKILEEYLFSEQTKEKIRQEENVSIAHFQVIMGKLRKAGVVIGNTLNPKVIPVLRVGSDNFKLLVYFEIKDESK